jgi:hypothetical protein
LYLQYFLEHQAEFLCQESYPNLLWKHHWSYQHYTEVGFTNYFSGQFWTVAIANEIRTPNEGIDYRNMKYLGWMGQINSMLHQRVSEVQFCTTEHPQLFEFELASCRTCRLRPKKAILEVATSNLQKWRDFAQSWGPCMPIWQHCFSQTKNLGLRCNYWPCSASHFLIMPPSSVLKCSHRIKIW